MAPLPIELNPDSISLFLSSIFISLILVSLILIKCMRHSTNPSVHLLNSSTSTVNKITLDTNIDDKSENSNSSKPIANIIIDETTLNELDTQSMPSDNKNASMMNLLQSHTHQSSFQNDDSSSQSVSTENILVLNARKSYSPSPLATPRDKSVKSLDNAIVLENFNSMQEKGNVEKNQSDSVSRDNSPVPDYDEVKHADPFGLAPQTSSNQLLVPNSPNRSPNKSHLKSSLSADSPSKKLRSETLAILDPPELPARNLRLLSLPSSKRRSIKKPDANTEEVYECIQDEMDQLHIDKNSSPPSKTDDDDEDPDNTYASVDQEKMKNFQGPPSLPAPRLPDHLKTSKESSKPSTAQDKKLRKKNRNSFHENLDSNTLSPEPTDTTDNRKKTKTFTTPFNKMRPSKKPTSSELTLSTTATSPLELSADYNSKIARGALPPLPPTSDQDDNDEQYTCIETSPILKRSKSSASSSEDPYSELTFDPTKNRNSKPPIIPPDLIAVDYTHSDDGNTSPMEIDQPYSSIEEVKVKAKQTSLQTPSIEEGLQSLSPISDSELTPRALPQVPSEPKQSIPHQYVRTDLIKKRKEEHRKSKEQDKLLKEKTSIEEQPLNVPPKIESETIQPPFMSLKSIFSDFHKEKDIVAENLSLVLGLPPPEPPNDSDDETQSYASAAEVRERKAKKVTTTEPNSDSGDFKQVLENESNSLDVEEPIFIGDIGDHTYSSLIETQAELNLYEEPNPYEEPKSFMEPFTPTYEDPEEFRVQKVNDSDPKSKISNEGSIEDDNYETLQFDEIEPEISPQVSQDLSKLRGQKGYVKVSHQKDNMPEYASIDDFQKEKLKAQIADESSDTNINVNSPTNTIQSDYNITTDILPDNDDTPLDQISKEDH